MFTTRTTLLAAGALTTALLLSACSGGNSGMGMGGSTPSATAESATSNTADVMFAQMMIPHHEQAVAMSETLLGKAAVDPRIVDLAQQIKGAQAPEITQLTTWLEEWGADQGMSQMHHGTDGMMSDADMNALDAATGAEAGKLFLEQMIEHHGGAIEMAKAEVADGTNPAAKAMAERIVSTQSEEIATMKRILATL
ncbi:DUF305 domain-containing protein [Plantibacter sp. Mn2098]|uniref:DUF305 domain-containing protein n=1 Tax=Plantibacter sp. Mn2098 TaxID=3395266 RepID=UPI003BBA45CC